MTQPTVEEKLRAIIHTARRINSRHFNLEKHQADNDNETEAA